MNLSESVAAYANLKHRERSRRHHCAKARAPSEDAPRSPFWRAHLQPTTPPLLRVHHAPKALACAATSAVLGASITNTISPLTWPSAARLANSCATSPLSPRTTSSWIFVSSLHTATLRSGNASATTSSAETMRFGLSAEVRAPHRARGAIRAPLPAPLLYAERNLRNRSTER